MNASGERRRKGDSLSSLTETLPGRYESRTKIYATSRQRRDELERRRAEEQAQQQAEAQRLIEEKMRREEEEQRRAEEERAQAMSELQLLQKQVN